MKKGRLIQPPWYDNGGREDRDARWGYGTLAGLAVCREGRALLESYYRLSRRKP